MTEEQTALARRAVACKGWKWMPGMLASDGVSVAFRLLHDGERLVMAPNVPGWDAVEVPAQVPDHLCPVFSDAATLGCLLALVREAYNEPRMTCVFVRAEWFMRGELYRLGSETTEVEALVVALETSP